MPLEDLIPWRMPILAGHSVSPLSSTATPLLRDPNDTSTHTDMNVGPPITVSPPPERPRVGRPDRGNRAKVKAARRARRAR